LLRKLESDEEPSLQVWANDKFSRTLVLVIANYLETEVKETLRSLIQNNSNSELVVNFLERSMERRYHEYFAWEENNANRFFSLFGETFKLKASEDVKSDDDLTKGVRAFLEVGRTRNDLIHKQLLSITLQKTADEFYELYKQAVMFTKYLQSRLK
jgi:hypothetical protein